LQLEQPLVHGHTSFCRTEQRNDRSFTHHGMDPLMTFENTQVAFSGKNDSDLHRSFRLFRLLHRPQLVKAGAWFTKVAIRFRLPIDGLIRNTIFKQFCAGESLEESQEVVSKLAGSGVGSILDYSVEGAGADADFENAKSEIIRIIHIAAENRNIPYTCLKLTGIMPHALLEKLNAGEKLSPEERVLYHRGLTRLSTICREAEISKVPVYIDAEESWVQEAIDQITEKMIWQHNTHSAIVNTTIQMYRHDRLDYLRLLVKEARAKQVFLGVKLVRGAYLEKENEYARLKNKPSVINPDKQSTDEQYDLAVAHCLKNIDIVTLCAGTHNEQSTLTAVELMNKFGLPHDHPHVYFSQLYGMSDNITYNLADQGYNVTKYVPYGPIKAVLPYLVRRAQENSAIAGQMGRELKMVAQEISRRYQAKSLAESGKELV